MPTFKPIRVIVFWEDGQWVAQCLEYDIGAQASSLDKLKLVLLATIRAEVSESKTRSGEAFVGIPSAPSHFEAMWEKRSDLFGVKDVDCGVELALAA